LSKTETGVSQLKFVDTDGLYDPTNSGSFLYGQMDPMRQAAIAITNPVDSSISTLFQGYIGNLNYDFDVSMKFAIVTIDLVDALAVFANMPMFAPRFGDSAEVAVAGLEGYSTSDVYFQGAGGAYWGTDDHWGPGSNSYHIGRINRILDQARWPSGKRQIFSGNVALQEVIYDRGTTVLEALFDCADAEFPGVANLYMSKDGRVIFHGRHARFSPANYASYGIRTWHAGDLTNSRANPTYAPLAELVWDKGTDDIINSVLALPQGIDEALVPGQVYEDSSSITTYGYRAEEFKDLLVYKGEKVPRNNMLQETRLFGQYYVDNFKLPRNTIKQAVFKVKSQDHSNALALWNLICGVEISDIVYIHTTHPAGGGFNESFFVEGIHYEAKPMKDNFPEINLTLDLSPAIYYASDPF
jgi:hypothetical protein